MFPRCSICTEKFCEDDAVLRPMHLIHCGHVFCHGCILRVVEIGSGICPNRCGEDAPIIGWTAIRLSSKSVAGEDQVSVATAKRLAELDLRQVIAEQRQLDAANELETITRHVQNQYNLIEARQRYLRSSLSKVEKSREAILARNKKQVQLISRRHRLVRARKLEVVRLQREKTRTGMRDSAPGPSQSHPESSTRAGVTDNSSGSSGKAPLP